MMCTANIPLERFFLFCLFLSSLHSRSTYLHLGLIYLSTFRPGFGLDHLCNEFTFACSFVMYTYTGNIHEREGLSVGFLGSVMSFTFVFWTSGYARLVVLGSSF
jgi:hypothetical protein